MQALSQNQMRITFGVIANLVGKVIHQIFLVLRITFGRLRITFQMISPKELFFLILIPFFRQNIRDTFYLYDAKAQSIANNDSQLRIILPKCVAIAMRLQKNDKLLRFLNPTLIIFIIFKCCIILCF